MVDILPLAMLVLGLTIIDVTLACAAFMRSRRRYRYAFVALMALEIIMACGYLLDVYSVGISEKLFWNNLEYVGYMGAIPVSFVFVIRFIGSRWLNWKRAAVLVAIPISLWISLVLNQFHQLFYIDVSLSSNAFISFTANHGPIFYIYVGYTLILLIAALGILIHCYCHTSGQHRKHVGIVMMATMIPLAATILNFVKVAEIPGPFLVIAGLFVSGILLYVGAFRFEMFEIVPFAFDRVVGTIRDSVFVLDEGDLILFMNPGAASLTGKSTEDAYHKKITEIVPGGDRLSNVLSVGEEVTFYLELIPGQFFDASVTLIKDPGQRAVGKLVILHDVTEQKRANDLAKGSEEKTQILNSITRHDINNQLMVVNGNVDLVREKLTDQGLQKNLASITMASQNIFNQLAFFGAYQEIGVKGPVWQNIDTMVSRILLPVYEKGIELKIEADNVEILADPQFEKVFYNLVDNSLTHGKGLSQISISMNETPEFVELVYQDDGRGISEDRKEHLFELCQNGSHGAGLFLAKKILAITGMTISEEGESGKGVMFVIRVHRSNIRSASV
jgi:signal transduction histidine kinase